MTPEQALDLISAHADAQKAAEKQAYMKIDRPYLGVGNDVLNDLAMDWRQTLDIDARVDLARDLWATNIFEARVIATKILTQARIKEDGAVWNLIQSWLPDFDSWAIADHACMAGQRRVAADPDRIDPVETWITSDHMWTRRAAFVITLPWTKQNFPTEHDILIRDRVLGWAAQLTSDRDWFVQKAIAWWVRDLSKHDPNRSRAFLTEHGAALKPFARKEAARHLTD